MNFKKVVYKVFVESIMNKIKGLIRRSKISYGRRKESSLFKANKSFYQRLSLKIGEEDVVKLVKSRIGYIKIQTK